MSSDKLTREDAIEAAIILWGQPTNKSAKEWRFGHHGSKSLKFESEDGRPVAYDHEAGEGYGTIELCRRAGLIKGDGWNDPTPDTRPTANKPSPWDDPGWREAAMEYAAKARGGPNDYSKYYQEALESEPGELLARLAKQKSTALLKSEAAFIADFVPPNYLVKRLLIQSYLYALTGQTGSGKTAVTLLLALCVATGTTFAGLKSKRRRVLYLAAENPHDTRNRWIALKQIHGLENTPVPVWFIENIFNIEEMNDKMRSEAEAVGGDFGLVIIDTGPAFFQGADANDRVDMFKHARMMRDLIDVIPGSPTVVANMHPTKYAGVENLVPAGGGSFLNEIDGNLTITKEDETVALHWQGKLRGVEFNPINFEIVPVSHDRLKDDDGDLIPTIVAKPLSDPDREAKKTKTKDEWRAILRLMEDEPSISLAGIAEAMGWEDKKWKAQRATYAMAKAKLIKRDAFGHWELTSSGHEANSKSSKS